MANQTHDGLNLGFGIDSPRLKTGVLSSSLRLHRSFPDPAPIPGMSAGLFSFRIRGEANTGLLQDRFSFWATLLCLIFTVAQIAIILVSFKKLPPELPIFYSKPWGEPMLAGPLFVWILPGLSFLFVAVNYLIARLLISETFLYRVLIVFAVTFAFAAFYDTAKIISLLV